MSMTQRLQEAIAGRAQAEDSLTSLRTQLEAVQHELASRSLKQGKLGELEARLEREREAHVRYIGQTAMKRIAQVCCTRLHAGRLSVHW